MQQSRLQVVVDINLIFENAHGEWLFGRREGTGYMDGFYALAAGHLEAGESLPECAAREALEELGVVVQEMEMCHLMRRDADHARMSVYFRCKKWSGELRNNEPDKCAGLVWRSPDDLPQPFVDHVAHAISLIQAGEMVGDFALSAS